MADKYYRLVTFIVNICPQTLRELFVKYMKADTTRPSTCTTLGGYLVLRKPQLQILKRRKVIRQYQWNLLFPKNGQADESSWDTTLVILLIGEFFKVQLQKIEEDAINDIRGMRDRLQHMADTTITDVDFDNMWKTLETATLDLARQIPPSPVHEQKIQELVDDTKINNMPKLGDTLRHWYENTIFKLQSDLEDMNEIVLEMSGTTTDKLKYTTDRRTILHGSVVTNVDYSGDKVKRLKTVDHILANMSHTFKTTMKEDLKSGFQSPKEIADIKTKLWDIHHVIVTGIRGSRYLETALAAIQDIGYNLNRCVEMRSSSDWQHIDPEEVDLVLCREPFGDFSFDEIRAKSMVDIFDSMHKTAKPTDGSKSVAIVIVSDLDLLHNVSNIYEHDLLEDVVHVYQQTTVNNPEDITGIESEWKGSIETKDEGKAYQLLANGQLPDGALLNKACQTFGLKSSLLKNICTQIEEKITASSDCIIYSNACYKETDTGKIVFCVITRLASDYLDLSNFKEKYNVLIRSTDYCSKEGKIVIDNEIGLRFDDSEMQALEVVLRENSPDLMKNHSNLTLTTGSKFKSHTEGAKDISVKKKVCIVFYVTIKGLIPVGENLLPKKLGQFDTDVREGRFSFAVDGQPGAIHKNLKIGCRISCKEGAGTIGGFVQHPKHGICAITCAHVVLSKEEILGIRKTNNENPGIGKECFQPDYNENGKSKCGQVIEVRMETGSIHSGVDAALIKINDDRIPTSGDFPDCALSDIKGGCLHCKESLFRERPSFQNGRVLKNTSEINTNNNVVKYGQKTKFTIGMLKVKGGSVRFEHCWDMNKLKGTNSSKKRYQFTMHNLLEINSLGPRFAEAGDSGALVFSQDVNNTLAAFGLLVGYDSATGITLVQPICSVLEHLGLHRPFTFINFDPNERRLDQLEKDVAEIRTNIQKISEKLGVV